MIRPSLPSETAHLVQLAQGTDVFKPMEIVALREVLDDYYAANAALGHRSVSYERDGEVLGFAYFAPAAMTDRTWYLYWIAVTKQRQARGIGAALLSYAEEDIQRAGGRIFLIETSSLPKYDATRKFYVKYGYEQHAVVHDFYADGDNLVIYRKRLAGPPSDAPAK